MLTLTGKYWIIIAPEQLKKDFAMNYKTQQQIEELLKQDIAEQVKDAIQDEEVVWDAANKLLKELLKDAKLSIWPNGNGFGLLLCGVELECEYDKEIKSFATDGLSLETLKRVKDALNGWQGIIDKAIDEQS